MDEFEAKLDRLERILHGTEPYGNDHDATPADQALRFQLDEMLDGIVARTRRPPDGSFPVGGFDLLVSLSGFSPMGTILVYHLLRPRQLLVIGSEETRSSINVIADAVVRKGLLPYSNFNHEQCDPADPLSIYRLIKARLGQLRSSTKRSPTAVIDITGGKKVMSAAAALAAWQLDLQLCYLDGTWSPRLRQHVPGQDQLLMLPNPAALFGDQEMDRARVLFDSGSFDAAADRYRRLVDLVREPSKAYFMAALSGLYQAWCDLDLDVITNRAARVRTELGRADTILTSALRVTLEEQLNFLDRLASGADTSIRGGGNPDLVVCFALLGKFYLDRGRKDFAAMLFHRALETALLSHLSARVPGLNCESPDYHAFPDGIDKIADAYREARTRQGLSAEQGPPSSIGMLDAVLLLDAIGDPILGPAQLNSRDGFQELGEVEEIRNGSVLAHGTHSISSPGIDRLINVANTVLAAYWQQYGDGRALERRFDRLAFIKAPF